MTTKDDWKLMLVAVGGTVALFAILIFGFVLSANAGGPSCPQQRALLAAGIEAAIDSIDNGDCDRARRQLTEAARDAGIEVHD